MKILVINGPNLNMLGKREPHIYGNATLDDLISFIKDTFRENFEIEFFQSNHEGEIIDKLHEASDIFDGVVINPGAFSHYSYAIYDAIKSININCVEVHISNIHQRQDHKLENEEVTDLKVPFFAPSEQVVKNKKVTKIMIFYSDNTFETFSPDNE